MGTVSTTTKAMNTNLFQPAAFPSREPILLHPRSAHYMGALQK